MWTISDLPEEKQKWRRYALCQLLNIEESDRIFFYNRGGSARKAREFCSGCPVKIQCLNYAFVHGERGVWAGTTEQERDSVKGFILAGLIDQAQKEGWLEIRRSVEDFLQAEQSQSVPDLEQVQETIEAILADLPEILALAG